MSEKKLTRQQAAMLSRLRDHPVIIPVEGVFTDIGGNRLNKRVVKGLMAKGCVTAQGDAFLGAPPPVVPSGVA
ncbi:hypothetical protein L0F51_00145 [Afifella sp. H1R]|uniref:hypothetical protein n=1 Tax=Afifella sp. H1R TaxID=2908841 RepID=UPI001F27DC7C|nr:hypothetical protein [Afifella sp. H1R]MCF1502176.1 hypothetical protein [Afifella sp. H1R]